jgi:Mrp family chromosome partitioning ATPase
MAKKNRKRVGQFQIPALNNASRTLLANIRFTSIDEKVKTIAVTSTSPDEGKTVVCANLACAIADSGKRVLLVDTDMRRRCIGTMLNIHPRYGLYSVLAGSAQLQSAITPHQETRAVLHGLRAQHPQPTRRAFNQTLRRAS